MNPIPSLTSYPKLFLICKRGQSDLVDMPGGYRRSFREVKQALVIIPGGGKGKSRWIAHRVKALTTYKEDQSLETYITNHPTLMYKLVKKWITNPKCYNVYPDKS